MSVQLKKWCFTTLGSKVTSHLSMSGSGISRLGNMMRTFWRPLSDSVSEDEWLKLNWASGRENAKHESGLRFREALKKYTLSSYLFFKFHLYTLSKGHTRQRVHEVLYTASQHCCMLSVAWQPNFRGPCIECTSQCKWQRWS